MEMFDEESDKNIIQDNANQYKQKIPEELYSAMKNGPGKNNMAHQHKTGWETD
jgi:hypothetical protein